MSDDENKASVEVPAGYTLSSDEAALYDAARRLMRAGFETAGIEPTLSTVLSGVANEMREVIGLHATGSTLRAFADTLEAVAPGNPDPAAPMRVLLNKVELAFQIMAGLQGPAPFGAETDTCEAIGRAIALTAEARELARRDMGHGPWKPDQARAH